MCKVCKMTLWFWLLSTLKRKPIKIYIYILMPTDSFVVPFSHVGAWISKATSADVSVSISLYLFALCSHLKIWSIHFAIESLPLSMVISQDVDINWLNVKKSPLSFLFFPIRMQCSHPQEMHRQNHWQMYWYCCQQSGYSGTYYISVLLYRYVWASFVCLEYLNILACVAVTASVRCLLVVLLVILGSGEVIEKVACHFKWCV